MPRLKHDELTDVQAAFIEGLTDQRVANMWAAADDWADLSPEAKEWLRRADKEKISLLNAQLNFYANSKVIWKFLLVGGGMLLTGFLSVAGVIKIFGDYFTVKFK